MVLWEHKWDYQEVEDGAEWDLVLEFQGLSVPCLTESFL